MTSQAVLPAIGTNSTSPSLRIAIHEWQSLEPGGRSTVERSLQGLSLTPADRLVAERLEERGIVIVRELRAGLSVETKSFAGWVSVGPLQITVLPKIGWSRWLPLIAFGMRLGKAERTRHTEVPIDNLALHDLLILELAHQSSHLIARGLHREYVSQNRSLASPRGHIDFALIAKSGGIRDAAIPCRFTRRSENTILNQAVRAALRLGRHLASLREVRVETSSVERMLEPFVDSIHLTRDFLARAERSIDRRTERYSPILRLARLLLDGSSLSLDESTDSSRVPIRGFAIDMNVVWEQILGRVFSEWLDDYTVAQQFHLQGLFRKSVSHPPKELIPSPRPDYAVFKDGRLVTYLDAKYRDLWRTRIPTGMLYQLSLYALAQRKGASAMLYPSDGPDAREQRLVVCDPFSGTPHGEVATRPVPLGRLEHLVSGESSRDLSSERAAFARSLIGQAP